MEKCVRCRVSEDEIRLFDAIYEGRMSLICERCSIIENAPIIKKPTTSQLKESEKSLGVYDRMKRMTGISDFDKSDTFFKEDKLNELNKDPSLELPEKNKLNLINYFHWEIMKNRRRKGLSQKQLAESLGESEKAIQMIEKKEFPENAEILIKKLEQFLQIKLGKVSETNQFLKAKAREPVLLNEKGEELDKIPEPKLPEPEIELDLESNEKDKESKEIDIIEQDKLQDFNIKDINAKQITISDLKNLHRRKIEATKQEKIEEQRRIEERQRLIEARKEELRLIREKESKELDNLLGGAELLGKTNKDIEDIEDLDSVEEFDKELI